MITKKEEELWKIIDDIDTALDGYKPEMTPFVKFIIKKVEERFKILSSDGYKLIEKE